MTLNLVVLLFGLWVGYNVGVTWGERIGQHNCERNHHE